jgi:hypothetical protein
MIRGYIMRVIGIFVWICRYVKSKCQLRQIEIVMEERVKFFELDDLCYYVRGYIKFTSTLDQIDTQAKFTKH